MTTTPGIVVQEHIDQLVSISELSEDQARLLLLKHRNNVEQALNAFFESGDTGETPAAAQQSGPPALPPRPAPSVRNTTPVIGPETHDDDPQLAEAIQASLQTASVSQADLMSIDQGTSNQNQLVPSTRAPDPNWAMVPSNIAAPVPLSHQEDENMRRAIAESLSGLDTSFLEEPYHVVSFQDTVRKDNRPVALRITNPTIIYAGLVVQALCYIPQVRAALAQWRIPKSGLPAPSTNSADPDVEMEPPKEDAIMRKLQEVFLSVERIPITEFTLDQLLDPNEENKGAIHPDKWAGPNQHSSGELGFLADRFYTDVIRSMETLFTNQVRKEHGNDQSSTNIFHVTHGPVPITDTPEITSSEPRIQDSHGVIIVDPNLPRIQGFHFSTLNTGETDSRPDLLSYFSEYIHRRNESLRADGLRYVISAPSDVIAFHIVPRQGSNSNNAQGVRYPPSFYFDPYLEQNAARVDQIRQQVQRNTDEVKRLKETRVKLVGDNTANSVRNLEASLYYYKDVANTYDDPTREVAIKGAVTKLEKVLRRIEDELRALDEEVARHEKEASDLMTVPDLTKYRYDLRAVLFHDGLFGRNHVYSYVKADGKWWKTVDYTVEEVSEKTVLNDRSGIHLGAGPFLVVYNASLSEESERELVQNTSWPEELQDRVNTSREAFLSSVDSTREKTPITVEPEPSDLMDVKAS